VQDQEPVLAADDGVFHRVFDELAARQDRGEGGVRIGGVTVENLRRDRAARRDEDVLVAAGAADGEPIPLVGFVVHRLPSQARSESMPPNRVGAPCVVHGDVVERVVVSCPGGAPADADDRVVVHLPGAKVLELQRVSLVADDVNREREDVAVQADRRRAQREEVVTIGLDVLVQQHLLPADLGVLVEFGGCPVVGVGDRATAVHAVLLALEATAVVPPVAAAGGHR
jgi:hypothetical protein